MAASPITEGEPRKPPSPPIDLETQEPDPPKESVEDFDYSKRAQWLRAAVLGANDGLLSVASLIMGIGAIHEDAKTMVLTGVAGLVGGASSMAIGEFVSVYSQRDIEVAQMKRAGIGKAESEKEREKLPNPFHAAAASASAFSVGATVPLLASAFVQVFWMRLVVVVAAVTFALFAFGWVGASLGKAPVLKSSGRIFGWRMVGYGHHLWLNKAAWTFDRSMIFWSNIFLQFAIPL